MHAVSVGESIAAAPMTITVTCMTPTGSERIQALFAGEPRIQHCYLPYDLPCAAKRFLDRVQPTLAVIMETELWPNHIHQCARRGIPVALANARLSARSAKGYARFTKLTAPMLAEMSLFAVQTATEAERFRLPRHRTPHPVPTSNSSLRSCCASVVSARSISIRDSMQTMT